MNGAGEFRLQLGAGSTALLRWSESATSLSLDIVLVPASHRGQGIGTALVQRVLDLADASARTVHVAARPIGSSSPEALERLVEYYARLGFVTTDRALTTVYMVRPAPARP